MLTISFLFPLKAFSSVQFSHSVVSDSLRPHESQHARPPCHHQLPESIQTHLHWISDVIQPSHPLSSPTSPAFNPSQYQGFSNESFLHIRWPKYWSFSFSISPSNEHSLGWTGWISLMSKDSQESSPTPQFKSINSLALSLLYSPILTSIHDYWKNHSLDETDLCWQSNVSAF